jgi:hypothetical protein
MHSTYRYITSLFLAAVLAAPAAMAAPRPQDSRDRDNNDHSGQVYDSGHKDYHNWNDNENQAWGRYESENHKKARDFSKVNKKQQAQYWNWRHSHPDGDNDRDQRDR